MNLKILLPSEVLLQKEVDKVIAEAENGSFCLLPHHVDFTASLVPSLFTFTTVDGQEEILAMDRGVLVKQGADVLVSARSAVRGLDLGRLKEMVEQTFQALDEREKVARTAAAKLEADIVRRFMELRDRG
jgi:F-type H+-transporting ATPase subunit epsilon